MTYFVSRVGAFGPQLNEQCGSNRFVSVEHQQLTDCVQRRHDEQDRRVDACEIPAFTSLHTLATAALSDRDACPRFGGDRRTSEVETEQSHAVDQR